jgi:mannose-6-phosphate isomerase-like protein (cupin superfamily)
MTTQTTAAFVTQAETVAPLQVVAEQIRVLAPATKTGSYEIFLQSGPEGAGPPPHAHGWDEAYFVLDGQLEVMMGDRVVRVSAGELAHVPRGTFHCFRILTPQAKFLSINSHRGAAELFTDIDRETGGAMDIPKLVSVITRHGLTMPPQ